MGRLRRDVVGRLPEPALRRMQRLRHGETPSLEHLPEPSVPRGVTPLVVTAFDAHAARADTVASVCAALDAAAIDYARLPGPRGTTSQVCVAAERRADAVAALDTMDGPGWVVTPGRSRRGRAAVLRAYRQYAAPSGALLGGSELACPVGFWREVGAAGVPRRDGGTYATGTRLAPDDNGVAAYLSPSMWQRATTSPAHWPAAPPPDVFEVTEPVDVVYTWVDGSDPAWRRRKAEHTPAADGYNPTAVSASRFHDREELRYSLRSLVMNANWVGRIHLVTDAQVPYWLDPSDERIRLVDHTAIFADPGALPVYNSHAIESQLHHIEGLREHYLYLNDDVFFGRPVQPELFFHGNGTAKFFLARRALDLDPPSPADLPVLTAAKQARDLVEASFGRTVHRKVQHGAHPQLRSVLTELEQRYPAAFDRTMRSRFRHPDDVSFAAALHPYYAYCTGRAAPGTVDFAYQDIGTPQTPRRLDTILRRRPQVFCLNDLHADEDDLDSQRGVLQEFLDTIFPVASPYELPAR